MKLIKDGNGNCYTADRQYFVERCYTGWDVHQPNQEGRYEYYMTVSTLTEFRFWLGKP